MVNKETDRVGKHRAGQQVQQGTRGVAAGRPLPPTRPQVRKLVSDLVCKACSWARALQVPTDEQESKFLPFPYREVRDMFVPRLQQLLDGGPSVRATLVIIPEKCCYFPIL